MSKLSHDASGGHYSVKGEVYHENTIVSVSQPYIWYLTENSPRLCILGLCPPLQRPFAVNTHLDVRLKSIVNLSGTIHNSLDDLCT
jgi:hypothetical protein